MQIKIFTGELASIEMQLNVFMPSVHRIVLVRVYKNIAYVLYKPDKPELAKPRKK